MSKQLTTALVLVIGLAVLTTLIPTPQPAAKTSPAPEQPAYVRVLLPSEKDKLTIEGQPTQQKGKSRLYVSPPLALDKNYTYTVEATWAKNGYTDVIRTRKVPVRAGQTVEVDLREADPANPDKFVILFVPTPDEVVEAMCKLAGVTKDDVVYDLGCGDGRMVITAVKKFSAKRGVGVDLDPERVKESKEAAAKSGVQDRLEFRQGDVLKIDDLADANVVLLYMGDDVNLRLRPILQKTLKPGSRIVSHEFRMGDWQPFKTETIFDDAGISYAIHLWKISESK
jgi:uncharacterized protein (TIGR03000 family)